MPLLDIVSHRVWGDVDISRFYTVIVTVFFLKVYHKNGGNAVEDLGFRP